MYITLCHKVFEVRHNLDFDINFQLRRVAVSPLSMSRTARVSRTVVSSLLTCPTDLENSTSKCPLFLVVLLYNLVRSLFNYLMVHNFSNWLEFLLKILYVHLNNFSLRAGNNLDQNYNNQKNIIANVNLILDCEIVKNVFTLLFYYTF